MRGRAPTWCASPRSDTLGWRASGTHAKGEWPGLYLGALRHRPTADLRHKQHERRPASSKATTKTIRNCAALDRSLGFGASGVRVAPFLNSNSALTLPSSGQPKGYALRLPLMSNVSALERRMKKSVVRALASGQALLSASGCNLGPRCTDAWAQPGMARFATFGYSRRASFVHRRHGRVAGSHERFGSDGNPSNDTSNTNSGPTWKCEDEVQPNAQVRALALFAYARSKWRSSRTEPQFNQRANPSIERTFQRPLRALWPAAHVKRWAS